MKQLLILLALTVFLSGCSVRGSIHPEGGGGGDFCPPGQAKKGNC